MYLNHHFGLSSIEKNYFPTVIHFCSFYLYFFKISVGGILKYNFGWWWWCLGFWGFFCLFVLFVCFL